MPKRITYLTKRADMTRAAFQSHWSGPHARIAVDLPGVRAYRQNHVLEQGAVISGIDGIVELWFEDEGAAAAGFDSDVADRLVVDEPRFLSGLVGTAVASDDPTLACRGKIWVLISQVSGPALVDAAERWAATASERTGALLCSVDAADLDAPRLVREALHATVPPHIAVSFGFASASDATEAMQHIPDVPPEFAVGEIVVLAAQELVVI